MSDTSYLVSNLIFGQTYKIGKYNLVGKFGINNLFDKDYKFVGKKPKGGGRGGRGRNRHGAQEEGAVEDDGGWDAPVGLSGPQVVVIERDRADQRAVRQADQLTS